MNGIKPKTIFGVNLNAFYPVYPVHPCKMLLKFSVSSVTSVAKKGIYRCPE
jgi:hypothetical protein